ncbi:MAG TPA: ABC transporter permease [Rhodopila sp.]|uniref:ABC transporter permease n=1 Tax=Rhodopila sp. TaxID=2480087 RepID=UPI002C62A211|nr:ABC transporter permease [Rhodopila sp.]HVY16338.1 ABC transporter permease [Rhodopila sp.]
MKPWHALCAVAAAVYLFIFAPIVVTASVSFNAGNLSRFPPVGFSLRWWREALDPRWLQPLTFSLELAAISAIIATLLGLLLAFGLVRHRFPGRDLVATLSLGPLALPALVTGIALLQILNMAGIDALYGFPALVIGHVVICLPFTVRTAAISLQAMPARVEQAAYSLGATPIEVLLRVTLPLIKSGVFAGTVFAFIQSFTDYSVSLFLTKPGASTISVTILGFLDYGFTPTLASVAVITLIVPLALIAIVQHYFRVGDFIYGSGRHG